MLNKKKMNNYFISLSEEKIVPLQQVINYNKTLLSIIVENRY